MNNDIQEDYCSFEVAKLLKEKGFSIFCKECYVVDFFDIQGKRNNVWESKYPDSVYPISTHALAIKWIRENFRVSISANIATSGKSYCEIYEWAGGAKGWERLNGSFGYESCYHATEEALLYVLKTLI